MSTWSSSASWKRPSRTTRGRAAYAGSTRGGNWATAPLLLLPPAPAAVLPRLVLLPLALAACALVALVIAARSGAEMDADAALATTRDVIHDVVLRDAPLGNGSGDDDGVASSASTIRPRRTCTAPIGTASPPERATRRGRGGGCTPSTPATSRPGRRRGGDGRFDDGARFDDKLRHSPYADPLLPLANAARAT